MVKRGEICGECPGEGEGERGGGSGGAVASIAPLELARRTSGGGGGGSLDGATGAILGMLGTLGSGRGDSVDDITCKLRGDSMVSLLEERLLRPTDSLLLRRSSVV